MSKVYRCREEGENGIFQNSPGLQIEGPVLCYLSAHHHLSISLDVSIIFQLLAISKLANTIWRTAKEIIQRLIRFLISPQRQQLLYMDWVCTLFG